MDKKCEICGKIISHEKEGVMKSCFTTHLRKEHSINLEDYLVKYELNGVHPKCLCGCGEDVHLNKTSHWLWNKYAKDSHVGRAFTEQAEKIKKEMMEAKKVVWDAKAYYERKYDINIARSSCSDFLSKQYNLSELSEKYALDRRTLQKMWFSLGLITSKEYQEITTYFKYNVSKDKRNEKFLRTDNLYSYIYLLIKSHPQKYTIYSALKCYNQNDEIKTDIHPTVLYNQMKKLYGDEIDLYLAVGYHSKEEYQFFCVLTYFFKNIKIELGHQIKGRNYIYDMLLNDKYIIEYDSKGHYHEKEKDKKNDSEKEKYAIENGYNFMRLNYDEIKEISILNRIKTWLNL